MSLLRETLLATPQQVLTRLPALGRLMVVAQSAGATHERLGTVEAIVGEGQRVLCRGASHDSDFDIDPIAAIIVDRSGRMKDTVLPRIEFLDAGGQQLFRVVGLEGAEKFDAGFAGIEVAPAAEQAEAPTAAASQVSDDDPGARPFHAAYDAGGDVTIELRRTGITQRWRGAVSAVRPAMGFINVMTDDFHLHLRGGAVATWRLGDCGADGEAELLAADEGGNETGLVLRGPQRIFAAFK